MEGFEKWNNYEIGKVAFINARREHPHRDIFVKYVIENHDSVVEIGAGELIEYQSIIKEKPIKYTIVDVSDTFCDYAEKFPDVKIEKIAMEKAKDKVEKHDIVYAASVLEHTSDIYSTLDSLMSMAGEFHFVMFKWSYSGGLDSRYHKKRKYWTTIFNINNLLSEIRKRGTIDYLNLCTKDGKVIDFKEYSKGKKGNHRTGDYLIIRGKTSK